MDQQSFNESHFEPIQNRGEFFRMVTKGRKSLYSFNPRHFGDRGPDFRELNEFECQGVCETDEVDGVQIHEFSGLCSQDFSKQK